MSLRDEIRKENLDRIHDSWFRSLYKGPGLPAATFALISLSLVVAAFCGLYLLR